MPPPIVLFVALGIGAAWFGGKAAWNKGIKPAGCTVVKVATIGHKQCSKAKPTAKPPAPITGAK